MASVFDSSKKYYIAANATYQVNTGRGVLRQIVVNTPKASSTITIIDGTAGSTPNIAVITNTTAVEPYSLWYNVEYTAGLRIITSDDDDITVVYD